jgi:hypothetical protein
LLVIITNRNFKNFDGLIFAQNTTIENGVVGGEKTEVTLLEASFNQDIPAKVFTVESLLAESNANGQV